jgi:hypothetical protein
MGTKISELSNRPTELTGAEVVPIVQSSGTYSVPADERGGGPAGHVSSGGSFSGSRGCSGVVKNSTGNYTITMSVARTLGTWVPLATAGGAGAAVIIKTKIQTTTTFDVYTFDAAGVAADSEFSFHVVGVS